MIGYLPSGTPLINTFKPQLTRGKKRAPSQKRHAFKMASKLSDYFQDDEIVSLRGSLDRQITGLVMDSRRVVPGVLFFALPGLRADGATFIDEAVARGAIAVVTPKMPAMVPTKLTFIQVADPRAMLAKVAQRYYKFPDQEMEVVGVTGTNGKTTVTHLIKHFLDADRRVGMIGTISYDLGSRTVPSFRTTPESVDIYGMMAQMRAAKCQHAVMEVSSHGIDQQRVHGLEFGVAVFTNLTRDHLDYHDTLEQYFSVKSRLFNGAMGRPPKVAVVNIDDLYGRKLAAMILAGVRTVTFGEDSDAMVRAEEVELKYKSSTFKLVWPDGEMQIESPMIGRYNVSNLLAAIATVWGLGRDPRKFTLRLANFTGVPGRMERIEEGQDYNVLVDYAHTDDALSNALEMLRAITPGRLMVVFGCGGKRDRAKRALMTSAVQKYADFAFATADNPRGEPLEQIFADMETGATSPDRIAWVDDRRRAISLALDTCKEGDCLIVAGKGHESYQEFADTVIPFDDRQIVRELIGIKALKRT